MSASPEYPQITVVTVAYNSMAVLPNMLSSLPSGTPVVIVDNAASDDPKLPRLCDNHGATLIRNQINRGFGAACNQGAAAAETDFLLFLNPDAELDSDGLGQFLAAARTYPTASAFNPRIVDGHGKAAFKRRSNLIPRRDWVTSGAPVSDQEVPILSGAAIFVAKENFDKVGGFDESIFLYYEDDDLSLRLAKLGPLMHIPGAVVRHLEGHSTTRSPKVARFKAYHLARGRVYARTKHKRAFPKLEALLRSLGLLVSPMMLSRRKRAKHLGYLSGVLSTFRDGGRHVENADGAGS